jgi:D-glycerate 3-kinase
VGKTDWIASFIDSESLPQSYVDLVIDYFIPCAEYFVEFICENRRRGTPFLIGINGAQGTGKTTFAKFLSNYLMCFHNLNGCHLSLDDFYLTRSERQKRAREVHPLFLVRGVPGTHDTDLAISTVEKLKNLKTGGEMALPAFEKARDDRKPEHNWLKATGVQDFIIFEGWCVGSRPVPTSTLARPINVLEKTKDQNGVWRNAVNNYLEEDYQKLFLLIDKLIFLKAPNFTSVIEWRKKQEEKLATVQQPDKSRIMTSSETALFVQYFERITRDNFINLPNIADIVLQFGPDHKVVNKSYGLNHLN